MVEKDINPNFEGINHGISPERLIGSSLNEIVICPNCSKLFWNPQMCSIQNCGITICQPCLKSSLEKGETCSGCQKGPKYEPNFFLKNGFLSKLQFRCINYPQCEISLGYDELPNHFCPHDQLPCKIKGCNWTGPRQELDSHTTTCKYEIQECSNEGCGERIQRGEILEHRTKCRYELILCPKECGFKGFRYNMEEHVNYECALVNVECKYKERGCLYTPIRGELQSHILSCLCQSRVLPCKHDVNLKDVDEHQLLCADYPLQCEKCSFTFTRGELINHQCLPFLLNKIRNMEDKFNQLERKFEDKFSGLERKFEEREQVLKKMLLEEQKERVNLEMMVKDTPILCIQCKNMKSRSNFNKCSKCKGMTCKDCLKKCSKCPNIYCKCTQMRNCSKCMQITCCAPLTSCNKCSNKWCSCAIMGQCPKCKMRNCGCSLAKCDICNIVNCGCSSTNCLKCNISICNNCEPLGICSNCIKAETKISLSVISATTTHQNEVLSNVLTEGNNLWSSRDYTEEEQPTAEEELIFEIKERSAIISKVFIRPNPNVLYGNIQVFTGTTKESMKAVTGQLDYSDPANIQVLPAKIKFIKLRLKNCKGGYFGICEVQVFGVQL